MSASGPNPWLLYDNDDDDDDNGVQYTTHQIMLNTQKKKPNIPRQTGAEFSQIL
jgi:hypothetical protein